MNKQGKDALTKALRKRAVSEKANEQPNTAETASNPVGRPRKGKRSDDAYGQVSAWVRKDTYGQVKKRLFNDENEKEFSTLVQELLEQWLEAREPGQKKRPV